jgi:hypothetical protein
LKSLKTVFVVLAAQVLRELSCRDWPIYFQSWTDKNIILAPGSLVEEWETLVAEDLVTWKKKWQSLSKYPEFKNRPTVSVEFVFLSRDGTNQGPTLVTKPRQDIRRQMDFETVSLPLSLRWTLLTRSAAERTRKHGRL